LAIALEGVRLIVDGRKVHDGGIGRYIQNLLDGLVAFTAVEITVLCFPWDDNFFHGRYGEKIKTIPLASKLYSLREMFGMRWEVPWTKYDLAHFPHFTVPVGIPIPSVVTVHDLIQITHPEKWYYPYIGRFYIRNALKRGTAIIAVSQQTAGQLSMFDRNGVSIKVIPNSAGRLPSEMENARRAMMGVAPGYFLGVLSNNKPHKGLDRLMEAFRIFSTHYVEARSMLPACGLILIGKGAPEHSFSGGMGMGRVSENELEWYYANARGIVVASDVEGFCLPVVEGRRLGVPSVVTPVPAIREILSSHDVVADDFSPSELARAMSRLVQQPPPPLSAMHADLDRFDLERTTHQIVRLYGDVLRPSGNGRND
jgi:glycosyltransferase involved in cell wall biosynthesis